MKNRSEMISYGILFGAVIILASVLFGIIFRIPLWYSYAIQCATFATLGYWFSKKEPLKDILPQNNKTLANIILVVFFTLTLLFIFGIIFVVRELVGTALACAIPFALALFLGNKKWNIKKASKPVNNVNNVYDEEGDPQEREFVDDVLDEPEEPKEPKEPKPTPKKEWEIDEDS